MNHATPKRIGINLPLVTVLVLCHNHAKYVVEALDSVKQQDYPNIQLLIVDDGSDDGSPSVIKNWQEANSIAEHLLLINQPLGMTAAFMQMAPKINGKYLIDLAADDILCADRVSKQVDFLESNPDNFSICYTNATLIDRLGNRIGTWYEGPMRQRQQEASQDLIVMLLSQNHICTPTVMYVVEYWRSLGGFNTTYAYEDLPIFLAFAQKGFQYGFIDECLTQRRVISGSATTRKFNPAKGKAPENNSLNTTLMLAENLSTTLTSEKQVDALLFFIRYHLKLSTVLGYRSYAFRFYNLIVKLGKPKWTDRMFVFLLKLRLPLSALLQFKPRRW